VHRSLYVQLVLTCHAALPTALSGRVQLQRGGRSQPRVRFAAMAQSGQTPPPRMNSEQLSAAAFGAASQALVAHSGTGLPAMGGKPGAQDVDLEDLFSLRRPKNVLSGASSGLQSVAKGARAACCAIAAQALQACRSRGAVLVAARLSPVARASP